MIGTTLAHDRITAALGGAEEAWPILERGEEERQGILRFVGMPPFGPLRKDPRFTGLLECLDLPPSPTEEKR